jgi:hypothetical protein
MYFDWKYEFYWTDKKNYVRSTIFSAGPQIINLIEISPLVSDIKQKDQHDITIMHLLYVLRVKDT